MNPSGQGARDIATLMWTLFGVGAVIYVVVMGLAFWALARRRADHDVPRDARPGWWLGVGGVAVPSVVLAGVLLLTVAALRRDAAIEAKPDMVVKVVGKQWWWEIDYQDPVPARRLRTANELHIPVGRIVKLELETRDVIHSLWVPELQGKRDLVPGRRNEMWISADRPGMYRGQCAEFCGIQHAKMALFVIAHPQAEYDAWYAAQLAEAAPPATPAAAEGQRVFLERPCAMCHAIRGTRALAELAPDLTHIGSRHTLAAGTLDNTRGNLGGWISNPQKIKPGTHMPDIDLSARELRTLVAYLESLR